LSDQIGFGQCSSSLSSYKSFYSFIKCNIKSHYEHSCYNSSVG